MRPAYYGATIPICMSGGAKAPERAGEGCQKRALRATSKAGNAHLQHGHNKGLVGGRKSAALSKKIPLQSPIYSLLHDIRIRLTLGLDHKQGFN